MSKQHASKSSQPPRAAKASPRQRGVVEQALTQLGLPLTRQNWLDLNYPFDPIPDPYPPELEAQMPNSIRLPQYRDEA